MNGRLLAAADAVIVHSRLVSGAVQRKRSSTDVAEIPHHVVPALRTPRDEARRALGIPRDRPTAVTLGIVTPAKRVARIVEALGSLPRQRRPFLFVGGAVGPGDPLLGLVRDLGLADDVSFGGFLSEEDFWKAASSADLAINLRHPTMGETSGVVCRLAGFGLPLVVSDTGWFRELPGSFASKIPVGGDEVKRLAGELSRIAFDPEEARRRSEAAAAWGRARHPDRVAKAYASVLADAAEGRARTRALSGRLAGEAAALGIGQPGRAASRIPDAGVVAAIAERTAGFLVAPRERLFEE
jgi:glycosyltransferase involved in cell wall biosynthesis